MFLRAGLSQPSVFGARLRRALLAAALAALCCASASAQSGVEETGTGGNHVIQGRIVFPSGRRADVRLKVRLQSNQSGELSVFTDTNGSFAFRSLAAGTYTVVIEGGDDFQTVTESVYIEPEVVTMITGMPTPPVSRPYTLQVYLQPKRHEGGDPAKAGVVDASLASVPKPAQDLYTKALEAEHKGDNQKAASLLTDAVAQYPQFGLAHNELGMIELKSSQLDKAVEEFKAAQKSLPDDSQVQFNYGVALLEKKDYAGAEKQLRRAEHGMGQSAQLHYFLGIVMIGGKQIEEAESQFRQSVKLGGDPAGRAHYYLGGIYWSKRDYKKAADELELYVKASPNAPDAEQVRGTIKELRAKK
ncbi:MAG TPA: tetratricopeptide repeat protein [Pyrinomonadaceae bacterium]|nr:tetratricopeptide repeat protein [Pyrinomonadaceae bacterium]